MFAVALAVVCAGIAGLFVSTAASWAVVGTGLFVIALGSAIVNTWTSAPPTSPRMTDDELDPVIHAPARLRIVATLAVLPEGDAAHVPPVAGHDRFDPRQPHYPPAQAGRRRLRQYRQTGAV